LFIINGAEDVIIEPDIARAVAAAAGSSGVARVEIVPGAGHGLGFYDDVTAVSERVIQATTDFLVSELFRNR
jgi:pimeloyl-ACP methyl ester carboxylesterase